MAGSLTLVREEISSTLGSRRPVPRDEDSGVFRALDLDGRLSSLNGREHDELMTSEF
jgi:hypothetical protein